MRTRLRACARGANYLPKDACKIPVPRFRPSMHDSSSGNSADESDLSEPPEKKKCTAIILSWQEKMENNLQRDIYIWQNSMWTDCTFSVGKEQEMFKCHRLFLAKSSPVFEVMLYGDLYKNGETIVLSDTSPAAFRVLLQYIYEGKVTWNMMNVEIACELLYMAKKYFFPASIATLLRSYIWDNMYPEDLWSVLEFCVQNNEPDQYECALKAICHDLEASLAHPSFLEISEMTLISLLKQELVHQGEEINLFEACITWAKSQVEENEDEDEDSSDSLREILEPIIPHIKFLSMKPEEFIRGPSKAPIFDNSDKYSILANLILPETCPLPSFVNNKSKCEFVNKNFFVYGANTDKHLKEENLLKTSIFDTISSIEFTKEEFPVKMMLSCQVPSQSDRYDNAINCATYSEIFTVYTLNKTKNEVVGGVKFIGESEYNSTTTCVFPEPMDLSNITVTDVIQVKVIYQVTGHYAKVKAFNPTILKSNPSYYKLNVIQKSNTFLQIVGYE